MEQSRNHLGVGRLRADPRAGGRRGGLGRRHCHHLQRLRLRRLQRPEAPDAPGLACLALSCARHLHRWGESRLRQCPALSRLGGRSGVERLGADPALRRPAGAVRLEGGPRQDRPGGRDDTGHAGSRRCRRRLDAPRPPVRQPDLPRHGGLLPGQARLLAGGAGVRRLLGGRTARAGLSRRRLRQRSLDDSRPAGAHRDPDSRRTTSGLPTGTGSSRCSATRTSPM